MTLSTSPAAPTVRSEYKRLLSALKEQGYRTTSPRRALLRFVARTTAPVSVPEMHAAVNARDADAAWGDEDDTTTDESSEEINLVTVYRFANLLVDLGLLRRIEFGEGFYRYEREEAQDGPHHHHLVCRQCGKITDFHGCDLHDLIARLEKESGYRVEQHQLELYGACPDCRTT